MFYTEQYFPHYKVAVLARTFYGKGIIIAAIPFPSKVRASNSQCMFQGKISWSGFNVLCRQYFRPHVLSTRGSLVKEG